MEYVQMTINDWLEVKHKLKMELQGVKQSFVRIGYALRKIEEQRLYENDGYKSIAEFAKKEYGLEASTVSRFMSINREYSIDGYSEHLREEYLDMGRSQLEEMLKLPDKDREMIRPETSREDIRDLKRFNKAEPAAGVADDIRELVEKFYEVNTEIAKELVQSEAYKTGEADKMIEIVNPGGNKAFKRGLFFMMMYEDSIKIKKFGTEPQTMSWTEFFAITEEVLTKTEKENEIPEVAAVIEEEPVKEEIAPAQKSEEIPGNPSTDEVLEEEKEEEKTEGKAEDKEPVHEEEEKEDTIVQEETATDASGPVHKVETEPEEHESVTESHQLREDDQIPGQTELRNDFSQYCPAEMLEDSKVETEIELSAEECMNRPYQTRREYMEKLTEEELKVYMAFAMGEMFRTKLRKASVQVFTTVCFWGEFFSDEVDENGNTIMEA